MRPSTQFIDKIMKHSINPPFRLKKLTGHLGVLSMLSALILASCGQSYTATEGNTDGTTDTGAISQTSPTVSPRTTPDPTADPSTLDPGLANALDDEFVIQAAQTNLLEISAGELAVDQANDEAVRQYAQRMVDDHSRATQNLQQVASANGIALPTDMGPQYQATLDQLEGLSGAEFDQVYMTEMVNSHQQAIALFQNQAERGTDQELQTWAEQLIPSLQVHLEAAEALAQK